jgi:ADP-heptose:LPS heptosyltransferase
MVLTLPLARALKERFPNTSMEMIARRYTAPLLNQSRVIDTVHFVDDKPIKEIIQSQNFDAVFFPRPVFSEVLAAFTSRIPLRIGSAYRWYSPLFNYGIRDHRRTAEHHEAEYNVRMLGNILGEEIAPYLVEPVVDENAARRIESILQGNEVNGKFVVIHPASGGSAYEWSAKNFGMAALKICEARNVTVLITGTESESEKCSEALEIYPKAVNLCGKLSLDEMIALLSRTSLLIANSTGVLHLAAALARPVLGLYPNTPHISAKRWGPYSPLAQVVSPPGKHGVEYNDAMNDIHIDVVVNEAIKLLA